MESKEIAENWLNELSGHKYFDLWVNELSEAIEEYAEKKIEPYINGIVVNGWKIEQTKHLSSGFLTWRAKNLKSKAEYIGKTKKECITWCENK